MHMFEARLFGPISIQLGGTPITKLPSKALELLCYLLLFRDRDHARESLSDLLWPHATAAQSQKYFRQTLWQLQASLDSGHASNGHRPSAVLRLRGGWIRVNPDARWWIDVDALERADTLCRDIPGQELTSEEATVLMKAAELYRGSLLDTWHDDWCLFERDRLQLIYVAVLEKLMGYCEAQSLWEQGMAYGQVILRCDRARESTYRQMMRLRYLAGDRTGALREYQRCVAALTEELQLEPTRQTVDLCEQLRSDRLQPTTVTTDVAPARRTPRAEHSPDLEGQVELLRASFSAFQIHVHHEMEALTRAVERQASASTLRSEDELEPSLHDDGSLA